MDGINLAGLSFVNAGQASAASSMGADILELAVVTFTQ